MNQKKWTVIVLAMMALASCTKDVSSYDEKAWESYTKAEYAANFVSKYPNIDLNQSWDFSTKASYYGFSSTSTMRGATMNRSGESDGVITQTDWYEVDNNTVNWMQEKLVESNDNRSLGNPFYMSVPAEEFTIVPIFQGQAGAKWDLHVVVGGIDYKVWEKSQDIQIQDLCNKGWHDVQGHPTYNWGQELFWESLANTIGNDKMSPSEDNWSGVPNLVSAIRAKGYKFSGLPGRDGQPRERQGHQAVVGQGYDAGTGVPCP